MTACLVALLGVCVHAQVPAPTGLRLISVPPQGDHEYFDRWSQVAHVAYALRSQEEINNLGSGGDENPDVRYDPVLDAARLWTRDGRSGISLGDELRMPVDIPEPTGSNEIWMVWDMWISPELEDAYRNHIQDNGGTKFWHIRGSDRAQGNYRDGLWKMAINIRTGGNCQTPCIGRMSTQMAWEHLGSNAVNNEPVAPSSWGDFNMHAGVFMRLFIRWIERLPVGDAVSTFSTWIADENRDPVLTHDEIQIRMPWSDEFGRGYQYIHVLQSWKETMPFDVSIALRNVFVLVNPGSVDGLLVKP